MLKFRNVLLALVVSLFATASMAQISIGISGTGVQVDGTGSETTTTQTRDETLEAIYGSVFIEFRPVEELSIGISTIPYTIDSETSTNAQSAEGNDSGTNTVQVDIDNFVMVYGLLHVPDTNFYGKVGISQADLITNESMGATSTTYGNATLDGVHVSLGYAYDTGYGVIVRAEAGFNEYDNMSVKSEGGDGTANTVKLEGLDGPTLGLSIVKEF